MAEVIISQQWLNSLTSYLNDLQSEATRRAEGAIAYMQDRTQDRARETPGWEALADEITTWSADGMLYIGVSNQEFISQAWVLEYGDEFNQPNPLFHTLTDQVGMTNEHARTQAAIRYGVGNVYSMSLRPLIAEPDIHEHTGFMLAEDEALKKYLTGIEVPGPEPGSPKVKVGCWFRWPTGERQIKYPFITIDSITAEPAYELFTSDHLQEIEGLYQPSVAPLLPAPPGGWGQMGYAIWNFLPFRLVYQVNVYSRFNLHDRYLRSIFATDVFPQRPFWIACDADNTWRRTEQIGYAATDQAETSESGSKRIFRKVYTVSMLAEVPQQRLLDSYFYKVFRVFLSAFDRDTLDPLFWLAHEGTEVTTPAM